VEEYPRVLGALDDLKLPSDVMAKVLYENAKKLLQL
jgi:predicted TIM-barrel fold metal-dependent hydrolase